MPFTEIDIFTDEHAAKVRTTVLRREGRTVKVIKTDLLTIYDYTEIPPKLEYENDHTAPIYLVQSEGD